MAQSYDHISAQDSSRQHNGNVYNNQSYKYSLRQRRSDETLRETARNHSLLKAAAEGQTRRVEHLIGLGADPDLADRKGLTALHLAALNGFEDTVEALLAHFVDINPHSEIYGTPLCLAAVRSRTNVIDVLLRGKANIHASGGRLGSVLHAACLGGNIEMAQNLLGKGLAVDMVRTVDTNILETLQTINDSDRPAIKYGSFQPLHVASQGGHTELVRYLVDRGADANATLERWSEDFVWGPSSQVERSGSRVSHVSALSLAASSGHCETLKALLQVGANIDAHDIEGYTALMGAAMWGHSACVTALIDSGASVDHQNVQGQTAAMHAAYYGNTHALETLLQNGAFLEHRSESGQTPLIAAARSGSTECVQLLATRRANLENTDHDDWTPFMAAAEKGHIAVVKLLITLGVNLHATNSRGENALAIAKRKGHDPIAKTLRRAMNTELGTIRTKSPASPLPVPTPEPQEWDGGYLYERRAREIERPRRQERYLREE